MKKEDLFQAIDLVDEKYLSEILEEEKRMKKKSWSVLSKVAVAALCLVVGSTVSYAAWHLLSPKEAAEQLGYEKVAEEFDKKYADLTDPSYVQQTVENDTYIVHYLGEVTGKDLNKNELHTDAEKTYYVTAIERKDETPISYDDRLIITPFVKGLAPWQFNVYRMDGAMTSEIVGDVLYSMTEADSIEIFADRGVYLGIVDNAPNNDMFSFDQKSGEIHAIEDYEGVNMIFDLALDPAKADTKKAAEYLESLGIEP